MSKNALALVDCNNRDQLFQFLVEAFDRKAVKNEMVSPYDEQLIGKMNFRYGGMEHAMFFTYARSSEYPGMRFRNHKIIYLSLGVNDISSAIFDQICARFGGFIDYNDDLDNGWQKIERQKVIIEERPELTEEVEVAVEDEVPEADQQKEIRQILKMERKQEQEDGEQDERPQEVTAKAEKTEKAEKPAKENKAPKEGNREKDGAKEGKPERRDNNRRGNRRGGRRGGDRPRGQRPEGQKADNAKQDAPRAERPRPEKKQEKPIEPQKG